MKACRHASAAQLPIKRPSASPPAVKDFLASGASLRLQLEQLPAYAPDLNPDEVICKHLIWVELKNLWCQSAAQLRVELGKAKERLRHKKHDILGCIREPGF